MEYAHIVGGTPTVAKGRWHGVVVTKGLSQFIGQPLFRFMGYNFRKVHTLAGSVPSDHQKIPFGFCC